MPNSQPDNFFPTIIPTPENLDAQRRATFEEQNKNEDFWVKNAGRAGLDFRQQMIRQGIGLSPEDRRAMQSQSIMSRAQQSLGELVKSGEVDPLDAQEQVVQQAMSDFMNLGDYQAAQALLPGLNQIRTYKGELGKLRSETNENDATAFNQSAEGRSTLAKTPYEIQKLDEEAGRQLAAARLDREKMNTERADQGLKRSQAGYYDRMPKAGDGSGSDDAPLKSTQAKYEEQMLGGASAINRLGKLTTLVLGNPGVGSNASAQLAGIVDETRGAAALTRDTGDPFIVNANKPVEARGNAQIVQAYKKKRSDLNLAAGEFQSLTMDLAYSLARARDSAGRLSDADIANALKIIGAAGDGNRMSTVMKNLADNTYNDLIRNRSRGEWFKNSGVNEELDKEYATFNQTIEGLKPVKAPPADTAAAPDADGWIQIGRIRIRKKPKQ